MKINKRIARRYKSKGKEDTQLNWDHKMSLAKKKNLGINSTQSVVVVASEKVQSALLFSFFFLNSFPVQKGSCLGGKEGLLVG